MARWEAGAEGRLAQAAYKLYLERGFDDVTVAEIAAHAGLTKRTYFRYFADKREVLFSGATAFQASVVANLMAASDDVPPIDVVVVALCAGGTEITKMGERARQRQRLIDSSPDLQEREMIKMESLTRAIAEGLVLRGIPEPRSSLTAQAGVAVFRTAFARWADGEDSVDFADLVRDTLDKLRSAIHSAEVEVQTVPVNPLLGRDLRHE